MIKKTIVIASVAILLSACVSPNNEDIGGVTGGVLGGLLGSQFGGGSGKIVAAVGGALLGSFIGGKIGKTMDRLDKLEFTWVGVLLNYSASASSFTSIIHNSC